jgi:hypothetical protein
MIRRWSRQASLLVTLIILAACGTPVGQPGVPPTATPTARTIVATAAHLPTPTRTTLVDQGAVTTGVPPGISNARQGDLLLELRTDKTAFVAGEAGRSTVTARNLGNTPVRLGGSCGRVAYIEVLDGAGKPVMPPWSALAMDCPFFERTIAPGEALSTTLWFAIPPADGTTTGPYTVQAQVAPDVTAPGSATTQRSPLLTPPLAVTVTDPLPAQHLRATLLADRAGWRLTATDQDGRIPPTPNWGYIVTTAPHTESWGQLDEADDGCWAGSWGDAFRDDAGSPIKVRIWLAVPGFVLAAITQDVPPDAGTRLRPLGTPASKCEP